MTIAENMVAQEGEILWSLNLTSSWSKILTRPVRAGVCPKSVQRYSEQWGRQGVAYVAIVQFQTPYTPATVA
jgi:hypothetical protein